MKKCKLGEAVLNKLIVSEPIKDIIELKFNRPSKLNAIDFELMEELKKTLHKLTQNKEVKAIILTGEGEKAFCSGGDIKAFENIKTKSEAYDMLTKMGEILFSIMTFPLPTFALLNGLTLGGGCEIATACDFRVAKKGISVGFIQGKLGITTGWGGATLLHEKLPYDSAMSFLFSSNKITVEKAKKRGFITEIMPEQHFSQEAYDFVDQSLVKNSSVLEAYKAIKINQWINSNLYSRMMTEINRCAELWATEEHHQAVEQFLSRRNT